MAGFPRSGTLLDEGVGGSGKGGKAALPCSDRSLSRAARAFRMGGVAHKRALTGRWVPHVASSPCLGQSRSS